MAHIPKYCFVLGQKQQSHFADVPVQIKFGQSFLLKFEKQEF